MPFFCVFGECIQKQEKQNLYYVAVFLQYMLYVQRICIEEIKNDDWFKKNYVPARLLEYEDVNLDDVNAVFDDSEVGKTLKRGYIVCYFSVFFVLC